MQSAEKGSLLHFESSNSWSGLNNQKLVLLGLCLLAFQKKDKISLPKEVVDLSIKDMKSSSLIPFDDVFDSASFTGFLERWNILDDGKERVLDTVLWRSCFSRGANSLKYLKESSKQSDFVRDFFVSLKFNNFIIRQVNEYLSLYGDFNENALALQLRIELDWQQHIERKIKKGWGSEWHYHTFDEIFEKIKNHQFLKNKSRIFACCDISGLDIDIRDLRGFSRAKYGFDLVIRDKDSGFYFKESSIKNAAFDFMLCLSFDAYVGLSRSTFSNLLCVTKSILSEKSFDHYVYDSGRSFVERRIDAGLEADPEKSTSLSFSIR